MKAGTYTIQATLEEAAGGIFQKLLLLIHRENVVMSLAMTPAGAMSNTYTYQFTLTQSVPAGALSIRVTGYDAYGNSAITQVDNYSADGSSTNINPIFSKFRKYWFQLSLW